MFRIRFLLLLALLLSACHSSQALLTIPAQQQVEIDYPDNPGYRAKLRNGSGQAVEVAVLAKATDEQLRGFGLAPHNGATVSVEQSSRLILRNAGDRSAKVRVNLKKGTPAAPASGRTYVSFDLRNKSASSIPLIIPSVMNPNLSPFSKSGVSLKMGQEILFREKGRKYVLLTVNDSIEDGAAIDVAQLLAERKRELGL
jgi:hypothetical protein